jgi:hypothetical protein
VRWSRYRVLGGLKASGAHVRLEIVCEVWRVLCGPFPEVGSPAVDQEQKRGCSWYRRRSRVSQTLKADVTELDLYATVSIASKSEIAKGQSGDDAF